MKTSIVGFSSIFEDISVEIIQVEEQKKEWIKRNPLDTIKSININKLGISKGEGTHREGKKIIKGNNAQNSSNLMKDMSTNLQSWTNFKEDK